MKPKILFITNKAPHYRIPFFNLLGEMLDIRFIFTHEGRPIKGLDVNYKLLHGGLGYGKLKVRPELKEIIDDYRPDKIVFLPFDAGHLADNILLFQLCKARRINFYVWCERWFYRNIPLKDRFSWFFYKKMLKKAKGVFVPGNKSREFVEGQGISKDKIHFAPNASEISYDRGQVERLKKEIVKKYSLENKKIVLFVGRLIKRKGVDYLIKSFDGVKDKDAVLIIVGGGDFYNLGSKNESGKLQELIKELDLDGKVIIVGEVKNNLLPAFFSLADLFVIPSITYKIAEAWGLVVNEAMQFGLPIISTDAVGSAFDLVDNGRNGFVVKEKNSAELREKINKVLEDAPLRRKMGKRSSSIVKKYDYKNMAEGFVSVLR